MALDKSAAHDSKPGSEAENTTTSLESDMALLASFLTNTQEQPPEDADDAQVDELLKRLTAADGVAKGVEERLDGIIDNLDLLLTALEKESGNDAEVPPETGGSDKTKEPSS